MSNQWGSAGLITPLNNAQGTVSFQLAPSFIAAWLVIASVQIQIPQNP